MVAERLPKKSGDQPVRMQDELSERQAKALEHIQEHGSLTIQDFERICPEVNRRTLQRDLKLLAEKGLLDGEGATNKQVYRLKEKRR